MTVLVTLALLIPGVAGAARLSASDTAIYNAAFKAADAGNWGQALHLAGKASDRTLREVLMWRYVRAPLTGGPDLATRLAFLDAHPDWPTVTGLRRVIETQLLTEATPANRVIDILGRYPPVSAVGKRALAQAYLEKGRKEEAGRLFREAWIEGDFSKDNEEKFLAQARPFLSARDHIARTDRLIWDGVYDSARRMIVRLPKDQGLLMQARITLGSGKGNPTAAVNAVPAQLRKDPGLVFERIRWRRKSKLYDEAIELLQSAKPVAGYERLWWTEQNVLIRHALSKGHITQAYRLASRHGHTAGAHSMDSEFLAGWIALRFLNDPKAALPHFQQIQKNVEMPISLSRGAYWIGRTYEAMGNTAQAQEWYRKATAYPATFYGQLAASRTGVSLNRLISGQDPAPRAPSGNTMARAVEQLGELGRHDEMLPFLIVLCDSAPDPALHAFLARAAAAAGRNDFAVQVARRAARQNTLLLEYGYPVPPGLDKAIARQAQANGFPQALAYGVIRQESNFYDRARSAAGALGLMQLMPGTAKDTAKKEDVAYRLAALTDEPAYNTRLGNRYLGDQLRRFDGSIILAAAAYNAGPGRPVSWINEHGDPRLMRNTDDIIDWIERIPFSETRNYVMRVHEGALVYRVRLGEKVDAKAPELHLRRAVH
ncbi:lytic transglycosylase domain-containing protein [Phaeovibrio sulfidiphilus]|uniref:Lytic transglycosylase domain-containing protein n=1 Tax=Phaeovibrio sulfidiphilus TaxID=1220600 RepID=A0A8J6YPU4_9PROT|nr:lytic transglycosylase domain-containing protein [Phaeovibrio sulfidiphilus]